MNNNKNIGDIGEDLACHFLVKKRYRILFRNYREKFDEIDIVVRSFDDILVFVEVKTLKKNIGDLIPEDNLTKNKLKKITRACHLFIDSHRGLVSERRGWRIDLIAVTLGEGKDHTINHYENITAT